MAQDEEAVKEIYDASVELHQYLQYTFPDILSPNNCKRITRQFMIEALEFHIGREKEKQALSEPR